MILFVLEAHRALHFGGRVNKTAQRIAGQRVVIAAGVHVLKFVRLVIVTFGVFTLEQETFDFVRRIERIAFVFV